ncbi:MAG: hypothetical protein HYY18_08360 [Planctomycetes bacterium]|nr:hypothetical protein [Planctomycetota bacterium]
MNTFRNFAFVLALLGGVLVADENPVSKRIDLRDAPLADAIREVEAATGKKIDAPAPLTEGKKVTFVARGTPRELIAAFGATLEGSQQLTLIGQGDGFRVHRFIPPKPVAPRLAPRGRRLTVTVVEGTVALVGDRGRVTVQAGEKSSVAAGALPAEPRPCDTSAVAAWRFKETSLSGGFEARIPLSAVKLRIVGWTEDGRAIVEYEVEGTRQQSGPMEMNLAGIDRNKAVVEGDELVLPLNIRIKLDKGEK